MTFRSLRILFAFIFISSYSSFAQCDFTLDIKVIQNSSCISNGIIQVNLSGEDVDLTKVQITLTDGGSINMMATANNQQFTTLPKGTYSIVASTICKNSGVQVSATGSATITSSYVDMVSYIGSFRKSLNCAHTGMIPIHIVNGRAPYKIQVTNAPAPYSGATSFTLNSSSDIFTLDDLPPGNYDFKVTDDCGYEIPLSRNLGTVASDFPSNPYSSSLHLATPPATDCNKVSVMAEYVAEELEYYWNENRDKYYEAAFTVNGSPKNWVSLEKGMRQVISLPSTIKSMRDNHDIVDVHLRIKGCSTERQNADNIFVFSILDISFWYAEFSCSSFISYFYPHYYSENPAYDYSYLSLICYPYKWEVYHVNTNTVVYSKDNVMDGTAQELPQLSFNEEYEIVVTDKEGVQIRSPFKTGRELYGYWAPNYCLPNPFTSQIYLYWPGSYIPAGTRIKQVSGVTPAKHPDITLSNDISTFFPFSTSYEESEYVTIEDGKYEFEITNTCGDPPYILTFEVRNYELRGDAYTSNEGCSGLEVTPTRRLYIDNTPQTTYYTMITAPEGANVLNSQFSSDDIGRYFTLPISGRYVFQLSLPWAGCATDTVEIIYERESFTLDSRSAYTCKTGDTPVFYFRAKNGMPPYTYELYENGAFVQSNSTGDFTYGSPNNSYSVRISDACGKNFTTEIQVLDLTFDQIVSGSSKVCVGDTIHLSCLSLGAKAFLWEGPNGTIVSTEQNPAIPNATLNDSGVYTLTLQPGGCSDPVIQRIAVEVYVPPALLSYPDTIDLCLNGDNTIPDANPLPNHTVVWFESDGVAECSKPAVSTATIHDEIFYVGQKNDTLGCVGDLQKVTIKVNRAPIPDFIVAADKACYQESAVLTLNNLNTSYIYDIYSDEALQNKLTSITNQASSIIDLNNFLEQTTAYYITVTDNLGCISEPLEQEVEVITLQITPDKLPPYRTNQDYSQQLSSNAVLPTFLLTTGELPIGLQLNALGLISGKVPTNKISSKWTFTVQVEDENGCRAEKLYTLNGDFFIPKVFTPNGDGVNDIFMSGYRVVIFDRLGITIYEGDSGWDGTYKGKEAVPDIYFYKLYYETGEGESKVTTGYIGLER